MKKYNVLYGDCPWEYTNKKTGGSLISGAASKYPTMSLEAIKALGDKIPQEKNAVLFLWATVPLLPEALEVMKAWGFKYKTKITWRKIMSLGLGYWYRGQVEDLLIGGSGEYEEMETEVCEELLFGTRGKISAFRMQVPNFYESKAGKHSAKPAYFRELIDKSVDSMDFPVKLELFARGEAAKDWDVFGNEVENSIEL